MDVYPYASEYVKMSNRYHRTHLPWWYGQSHDLLSHCKLEMSWPFITGSKTSWEVILSNVYYTYLTLWHYIIVDLGCQFLFSCTASCITLPKRYIFASVCWCTVHVKILKKVQRNSISVNHNLRAKLVNYIFSQIGTCHFVCLNLSSASLFQSILPEKVQTISIWEDKLLCQPIIWWTSLWRQKCDLMAWVSLVRGRMGYYTWWPLAKVLSRTLHCIPALMDGFP